MEAAVSGSPSELKNILLKAGAGAGKTTTLVNVFLDFTKNFIAQNKKTPRIVVTTFTRKATQELKERLLKKALEEKREDLFHFISSKSSVQISTIHGVLNLFLSRYGALMGLTPDYKILSESEIRKNARKILRRLILEKPHWQELLEEYEFATLESYLLKYFSEVQLRPDLKPAGRDFFADETARVLSSLAERFRNLARSLLQQTDQEKWVDYFNIILAIDWNNEASIESFYENSSKPSYLKKNPPFPEEGDVELKELLKELENFCEDLGFQEAYWDLHQKNCDLFAELAAEFCREFEKQKLEQGQLSMSDLETLSYRLVLEHPSAAEAFSREWDFWMIDEYQDTSPVQVQLMRALTGDRPHFVVGDPQQSIYLFRGARSEVFMEKMSEVRSGGGEVQEKLVNYRSSSSVLKFINHYFTRLDQQFSAMEVAPDKGTSPLPHSLQVLLTQDDEDSDNREELAVVVRLQELLFAGVSPESICVLARTHRTLEETARLSQSFGVPVQLHSASGFFERREVQDALNLLKFLVNPHDNYIFLALLRSPWFHLTDQEILPFCHDKKHSFWREAERKIPESQEHHPVRLLRRYLGFSETLGLAWTLKRALMELSYLDYSRQLDPSGRREANLWKILSLLGQEERRPGFNFLDFIESGLESLSTEEGGNDADATPVIEPKRVNFMTVHASKGLQFAHVIVPALSKNPDTRKEADWYVDEKTDLWTLPVRDEESQKMVQSLLARKIHQERLEREEKEFNRVLYVALTRAKEGITLVINKKIGKKSWASFCPLDLSEGLHEEDGFSYLVRNENLFPQKMRGEVLASSRVRSPWMDMSSQLGKATVSVTELLSSSIVVATEPSARQLLPALKRAQQGTEAHRLFESLKYISAEEIKKDLPAHLVKALDYVVQTKDLPLARIIQEGFVEWGFACQEGKALLQGQIDLWGLCDGKAWIVDYKTGSDRYKESAFQQMEIYAWALRKMGRIAADQEIRLAVVYPLEEKSETRIVGLDLEAKVRGYFKDL
jgi:ATP-dependent helicase/nuclease subunit A